MIAQLIKDGKFFYDHNKLCREEILKYSEYKFRKMLRFAIENTVFYKKFYLSRGINPDNMENIPIDEIPIIDKKIVKDNFYDIVTKKIKPEEIENAVNSEDMLPAIKNSFIVHTSGSTGEPTNFIYNKKALRILEANFARLSIGGQNNIGIKDFPIDSLYIAPVGSGYACTALAIFGMHEYRTKSVIINAQTPLSKWKSIIEGCNPNYLSGYPSCIKLVAELIEKGEIHLKPKKIITGGEPLTSELQQYFKKIFSADIIDYYGCTESILIGAGTTYYNGIYLFDDINYVEKDEIGRLIITPLYNKAFPLIRYRLNDIVDGFNKDYEGELPYTHINKVIGRKEDLMWFVNENGEKDFLHPLFLDDLNVNGIINYQFVQNNLQSFELKCVSNESFREKMQKEIISQMDYFPKNKKMRNVKYNIDFVDYIPADKKTGKTKLVIKNIS